MTEAIGKQWANGVAQQLRRDEGEVATCDSEYERRTNRQIESSGKEKVRNELSDANNNYAVRDEFPNGALWKPSC